MSDISIRFDGLALLVVLALSGTAYFLLALAAMIGRRRGAARLAAFMGLGTLAATGLFLAYWVQQGTAYTGLDVLDLLIFPWLVIFLAGCWRLKQQGRR